MFELSYMVNSAPFIQLLWLALLKSFIPPSNNNGQLTKKTDHSIVLKFDCCYNQLYFKLILLPLSFNELKALLCRSNRGMLCLSAADRDQQSLNEPTILETN